MDSFYDVPRRAPIPTNIDSFLAGPTVPEVSMICPPRPPQNHLPYNSWKKTTYGSIASKENRESINYISPQNSSQSFKKQVRFESPVQKQTHRENHFIPTSVESKIVNSTNQFADHPTNRQITHENVLTAENSNCVFKRMYMANIPHRELDLSIIDLPKQDIKSRHVASVAEKPMTVVTEESQQYCELEDEANKENAETSTKLLPKSYREFLAIQNKLPGKVKMNSDNTKDMSKKPDAFGDDSITDIFNYRKKKLDYENRVSTGNMPNSPIVTNRQIISESYRPQSSSESPSKRRHIAAHDRNDHILERHYKQDQIAVLPLKCDGGTQTTCSNLEKDNDQEPTNRDLLKIIAQQNEQLLILQKQVAMLLNRDQQQQTKQIEAPPARHAEKLVSSTQNEYYRPEGTPKKRGMSKFSIDLMTSFEVAIRPQANKQNFINMEPKIQEITEMESVPSCRSTSEKEKDVESSLHFPEPVLEPCPSPEPSININMQDYDSSDEEATVSDIGATFYRNLMGQVNQILKKAHVQTQEELAARDQAHHDKTSDKKEGTMSRVKEVMVKHLKSIGVTVDNLDDTAGSNSSANDSKAYTPTEISFAVKQLLMKYLPSDQLAKVAQKQAPAPLFANKNPTMVAGRPEFSFASVQYMKKYNLLPTYDMKVPRQEKPKMTQPDNQKILDMTALKMQPKLL